MISTRTNKVFAQDDKICAYHRYNLGTLWRAPRKCLHPLYNQKPKKRNGKKPDVRPSSNATFYKIKEIFPNELFPILSNLCTTHRKFNLEKQIADDNDNDYNLTVSSGSDSDNGHDKKDSNNNDNDNWYFMVT